jgi:hypothetical protein
MKNRGDYPQQTEGIIVYCTIAHGDLHSVVVPVMLGHRMMGSCMLFTGSFAASRAHFDQARTLYDSADHRPLATRFGIDHAVSVAANRSWASWFLGYPVAALLDADHAITKASLLTAQTERRLVAQASCRTWHALMENSANSTTRGDVSAKH